MKTAISTVVSKLGLLAGLAGIEHGIGEVLQGNVATEGLRIVAWPGWELFRILAGEPAMTVIPNFLVTGIVAILVSLAYIACVTVLAGRKNSGPALILLAVAMLLTGAGYGSAILAFIVGLVATGLKVRETGRRTILPAVVRQASGKLWPAAYKACIVAWLLLMPGTIILACVFGTDNVIPAVPVFILAAFGTLLIAVFTGFVYDGRRPADQTHRNDCIGEARNTASI
jgi:hypothetical protein